MNLPHIAKYIVKPISLCALLLLSQWAQAEIAVIVHPSNSSEISAADISRIYSGKLKTFSTGGTIVALDQAEGSPVREAFVKQILNKTESQLKAYWSKLVFSGQGQPPKVVESSAEILTLVAANPNMIGFVDAAEVTPNVKVVGKF
ncbi:MULTISPECIES: substrate-binding domain-containing protein [Shewanella]|jgi:ABC-type phosphate transport system substrate-binding protein|uniref:Phosphate ABC transporter substrate-binding protein n=1 Tax=Shewanella xiamenensis TaxID=332186 RepID=A0A1E3V141_9GAMM|nr:MULTISPECIES: substrate-binding domain-containing protein [Shewanella]PZP31941.1 MAG: phosphate ABC transporter substrate-binding protein [Shewanella oneidensis]MBW0281367.1 phosphate ABC transporter substrate-binding protein [Shewanella xiamenensis]MBW0298223.1 phosphate ABC transporter substrate-binding protein [Shewanella xiamenensis]MCD8549003.1 substrate-binding domain-containing protein [Shewanella xiamenensis]MCD8561128.1 substrate-binding domain-containing protein [Shewanella xiamen